MLILLLLLTCLVSYQEARLHDAATTTHNRYHETTNKQQQQWQRRQVVNHRWLVDDNVSTVNDHLNRTKYGDLSKLATILGHAVLEQEMLQVHLYAATATSNAIPRNQSTAAAAAAAAADQEFIVDIIGTTTTTTSTESSTGSSLWEALQSKGMRVINCYKHICSAYATMVSIVDAAQLEQVKFIQPGVVESQTGTIESQGDLAMYANLARADFGVNGTGVKVGVISVSYNCLLGAASDIATGNLPDNVDVVNDLSYPTECINLSANDEGRAMLEIIYDVAPGAQLAFRTGYRGTGDMIAAIYDLVQAGCNIIVSDLLVLYQPFFMDGFVAQTADMAASRFGVSFFAAAGNYNGYSWQSPDGFQSSNVSAPWDNSSIFHQFGTTADGQPIYYQNVTFPYSYKTYFLLLQWDDPFYSTTGSVGASSDVDIFLLYNGTIVTYSNADNIGKDAYEVLDINPIIDGSYTGAATVTFSLAITLKAGPPPSILRIISNSATFEFATPDSPTVWSIANGANTAAVGAVNAYRTPWNHYSPPEPRAYSSTGPTPILFDVNGNRLKQPEIRKQPRFMGPDGVQTTFFGVLKPDGIWRFPGTSASSPNAAAVAALLLQSNESFTPKEIYGTIGSSCIPMGQHAGFNYSYGYGFVDALHALQLID